MYYTHLVFALLLSLSYIKFFAIEHRSLFALVAVVSSLFPDIDETKSKIGRKAKILSNIINLFFGHRGIFHTVYPPIILFVISSLFKSEIAIAVVIGYSSHLFLDSLTPAGIRPLYPITNKKINGPFKTNSLSEKIMFLAIIFVDIYMITKYIF